MKIERKSEAGESYWFASLICNYLKLYAELDITYLASQDHIIPTVICGGDIDNKLKGLFDALRCPPDSSSIPKDLSPIPKNIPVYCLLEDDGLIRKITVATDRLLDAIDEDSFLMLIKVKVKAITLTRGNISLAG
ncbi:MAG: hypothetical protein HQL04_05660 [Nitrospirae bacterium]|nr:hypothetical protein [Nitrospirota bacterium]